MNKIWAIAAITFKEGIRNRALQGILCIAILLCLGYLAVIPMFAFETGKVMVDLGSASVSLAGLVIVVFLSISMLTKDVHQRSVCLILSRPVSRVEYVMGKFSGLAMMVLASIAIIAAIAVVSSAIGFKLVPEMEMPRHFGFGSLLIVILFKYLSLLILLAIAFLFTIATTNEYLSMLLTMMLYFIGHSLETVVKVASIGADVKLAPAYLSTLKALTWIFPNFNALNLNIYLAYGLELPWSQIAWTGVYGILYSTVVLFITIAVFSRKEIR